MTWRHSKGKVKGVCSWVVSVSLIFCFDFDCV